MLTKKITTSSALKTLLSTSSLVMFLLFVEPSNTNFSLSFVPLLLLWLSVFFLSDSIVGYVIKNFSLGIKRTLNASVASTVVLLVMFSALGQLGVFDVLLLIALAVLGIFYFSRTWPK